MSLDLPDDVWTLSFSYLDGPDLLGSVAPVCRRWRHILLTRRAVWRDARVTLHRFPTGNRYPWQCVVSKFRGMYHGAKLRQLAVNENSLPVPFDLALLAQRSGDTLEKLSINVHHLTSHLSRLADFSRLTSLTLLSYSNTTVPRAQWVAISRLPLLELDVNETVPPLEWLPVTLTSLRIRSFLDTDWLHDETLRRLAHLTHLERLSISCADRITAAGFAPLAHLPLKHLFLSCCSNIGNIGPLTAFPLESLRLECMQLTTEDILALPNWSATLTRLSFYACTSLTSDAWPLIVALHRLQSLNVSWGGGLRDQVPWAALSDLPLTELDANGANIAQLTTSWTPSAALTRLSLASNSMDDSVWEWASQFPRLRELDLGYSETFSRTNAAWFQMLRPRCRVWHTPYQPSGIKREFLLIFVRQATINVAVNVAQAVVGAAVRWWRRRIIS